MGWLPIVYTALAARMSEKNYASLPELATFGGARAAASGHVSIIVPARNEASSLPTLLESLQQADYPDFDVTVVDDCSEDNTATIAQSASCDVIRVESLPDGWVGKSFACWTGARRTKGKWLLFTDADTIHCPETLGLSIAMANAADSGLTSLLARQRCESFWERLLLPYAYALYFAGARGVNRDGKQAVANGQYMLFRRTDYERIGGHQAVAESLIEDLDLASLAARCGLRVILARADEHLQVRMYSGLGSLWEGFAKNSFRIVKHSGGGGILTILASLALLSSAPGARRSETKPEALLALATPVIFLSPWMKRFGVSYRYALLYPLAAVVFQLLALDSIRRSVLGRGTIWKGRKYR